MCISYDIRLVLQIQQHLRRNINTIYLSINQHIFITYLLKWPEILILDEGHLLKNEETKRNNKVSMFKTKKRLILSGSPIQNNIEEFTTMIKFVNEKRSEEFTHDKDRIRLGNVETLKRYSDVICRRLIKDTIKDELPPSYSVTLFLNIQETQKKIFDVMIKSFDKEKSRNVFLIQEFISWVLVHPAILY